MEALFGYFSTFKYRLTHLCSFVSLIVTHLCNKIAFIIPIVMNLMQKFTIRKMRTFFASLILFSQIIDLTISYSQYNTVIEMKVTEMKRDFPAVSLCINSKKEINKIKSQISVNQTVEQFFNHNIKCLDQ